MLKITYSWLWVVALALSSLNAQAEPAQKVLGRDYVFPNKIAGLPAKLSDFKDLEINAFTTGDGVRLTSCIHSWLVCQWSGIHQRDVPA